MPRPLASNMFQQYTCVVCYTTSSSVTDCVTFHTFPRKKARRSLWCEILQLPKVNNQSRICSQHFSKNDFIITKQSRRIIKPSGIPIRYYDTMAHSTLDLTINASQDNKELQMFQTDSPSTANTSHITPMRILESMETTLANNSSNALTVEISPTSCVYLSNYKPFYGDSDADEENDDNNFSELLKKYFDANQINDILHEQNFYDISKSKEALFKLKNVILSLCQDKRVLQQKIKVMKQNYQLAMNMVEKLGGHITNDPTIHHV